MKKYLVFVLLIFAFTVPVAYSTPSIDLLTSQEQLAGKVIIDRDSAQFNITLELIDGWCLKETYIHTANRLKNIPRTINGDPNVDEFTYNMTHECIANYTLILDEEIEPPFAVAVYAAICRIVDYAPDYSQYANITGSSLKVKNPGSGCYFDSTFVSDQLSGVFQGWCIDTDNVIYNNVWYDVEALLSTEPIPVGLLEYPENLDLVNYILNQSYLGRPSPSGGTYTMGDIQRAIWTLMEDVQSTAGIGSWSQLRVDEILNNAYLNGEGYTPGVGDSVAIILYNINLQITVIMVPVPVVPVYECETCYMEYSEGDPCRFTVGGELTHHTENYLVMLFESMILVTIYAGANFFQGLLLVFPLVLDRLYLFLLQELLL